MHALSLPVASGAVVHPATPAEGVGAPAACASCGASLAGEFCHACGQRRHARFTLRGIFAHLVTDAFDLNRGLLATAVALFRWPGEAIREYVAGATVRYTNPVKYLIVCVALAVFLSVQLGVTREMAGGFVEGMGPEAKADAERIGEFMSRYMNVILVAAVPFMAAFSRLLFRRAGLNFAEHLIFNVYVYAQQNLLFLPFVPLTFIGATKTWGMLGYTLVNAAYYALAATVFFRERPLPGVLRSLAVVALGSIVYYLGVGIVAAVALHYLGLV